MSVTYTVAMATGMRGSQPRCWCRVGAGGFEVQARIERFQEAAILLRLRAGEAHGYQLAEDLAEVPGEGRVDLGNLYRMLRGMEADGMVRSSWRQDLPGPLKRTYELTDEGSALLDAWAESLRIHQQKVASFLARYDHRGDQS